MLYAETRDRVPVPPTAWNLSRRPSTDDELMTCSTPAPPSLASIRLVKRHVKPIFVVVTTKAETSSIDYFLCRPV
ncbi:unnamed protein product [Soboliphyme baturini]|uniref:Uncharacterized protein n=1 Tax=Soboliphyme baturini TaxID=241478 RepID=A0A183IHY4_9BILA|nr:unnamed protein product [Soboliphyme baturini]